MMFLIIKSLYLFLTAYGVSAFVTSSKNSESQCIGSLTIAHEDVLRNVKYLSLKAHLMILKKKTQDLMAQYASKFYMDEDKIKRTIGQMHRWEQYKQKVVRTELSEVRSPR